MRSLETGSVAAVSFLPPTNSCWTHREAITASCTVHDY